MEFVEQLDDVELSQGYFQQDGATCHTPNEFVDLIASSYDDRIISRNLWSPRSSYLTTPDFFLWNHLKDRVYATRPQTLDDLKHNITQEIQAIDNRVLQRVASNMEWSVELCLMQDFGQNHQHHQCYDQGQALHFKLRHQGWNSVKRQVSIANSGT